MSQQIELDVRGEEEEEVWEVQSVLMTQGQ